MFSNVEELEEIQHVIDALREYRLSKVLAKIEVGMEILNKELESTEHESDKFTEPSQFSTWIPRFPFSSFSSVSKELLVAYSKNSPFRRKFCLPRTQTILSSLYCDNHIIYSKFIYLNSFRG